MTRVAWFGPMPPARTGVAAYSRAVVDALSRNQEVDVFVDESVAAFARSSTAGGTSAAARPRSARGGEGERILGRIHESGFVDARCSGAPGRSAVEGDDE